VAAGSQGFKYRAFISYCHKDRWQAEKLHRSLEHFLVPRALIARSAADGVSIPRKLGRVFIDRYELAVGHLPKQLQDALGQSENLIVICSPEAAESACVNEEIRLFRKLGRGNRIFPIILDGEPGGEIESLFPPALSAGASSDGFVPASGVEILAADARRDADGWHLAKLKLVSALLGIDLDELRRREAMAERRRRHIWTSVAAVTSSLAVVAVVFGFYANDQYRRSERLLDRSLRITVDFADKVASAFSSYQMPAPQADRLLNDLNKEMEGLLADSTRTTFERRLSQAEMMLAQHTAKKQIGSLGTAESLAQRSKDIFSDLRSSQFSLAGVDEIAGASRSQAVLRGLAKSCVSLGLIKRDAAYLREAAQEFREALEYRGELAQVYPHLDTPVARRARSELADAHYMLGEVLERSNKPVESVDSFTRALILFQEVEAATARNSSQGLKSGLNVFVAELKSARLDVTRAKVELAEALGKVGDEDRQFQLLHEAVSTRQDLLKQDPHDRKIKRYLAWAHVFRGEAYLEVGRVKDAISDLERAVEYQRQGLEFDPANTQRRKDYTWAKGYLARALLADGQIEQSLAHFDDAVAVAREAYELYSVELMKRRNLAYWLGYRAKAKRRLGRYNEAAQDLTEAEELLRPLSESANYPMARGEMAFLQLEFGFAAFATGDEKQAQARIGAARAHYLKLMDEAPQSKVWPKRLAQVNSELLQLSCGLLEGPAPECWDHTRTGAAGQVARDPGSAHGEE
jgi:eukaryotic-like serine/threonine-protein kinase